MKNAASQVPRRVMGKTGAAVSVIGLGGITVMHATPGETAAIVGFALDHGVNYFDVAPSYGHAEERYGPALAGHRDNIFLAGKTLMRDRNGAANELRSTLRRLRTDRLDLYQMHALNTLEEVDQALGPGGAVEAFQQARQAGLVRHLGFSSHSVQAALAALRRFAFDTIMFPVNWICGYQGDLGPQVLDAAHARNMGIIAIKAMAPLVPAGPASAAGRRLPPIGACRNTVDKAQKVKPDSLPEDDDLAALGLRFALSQPIAAALPRGHAPTFRLAVAVAEQFTALSAEEYAELQARSADYIPLFRNESPSLATT